MAYVDKEVEKLNLVKEYNERILQLHGNCFYEGITEIPGIDLKKLIIETGKYIENAKKLSVNK